MLAQPKRKLNWTLNPRGNLWANDEQKFGQKLMEKMGWQKGKGLGKSENGNVDNIKVVYKCDNNGIGWDNKSIGWISHQDEFDALLTNLNNSYSNTPETSDSSISSESNGVNLEQRAKLFKSRLHYKKFLKGKDVAQYSEKDIESIIGKKFDKSSNVVQDAKYENKHEEVVHHDADDQNLSQHDDGVMMIKSSTNMADYFSEKMKNRTFGKLKDMPVGSTTSEVPVITTDLTSRKKKKKRKKLEVDEDAEDGINSAKKVKLVDSMIEDGTIDCEATIMSPIPDISKGTLKSCLKKEIPYEVKSRKSVTFSELPENDGDTAQVLVVEKSVDRSETSVLNHASSESTELCIDTAIIDRAESINTDPVNLQVSEIADKSSQEQVENNELASADVIAEKAKKSLANNHFEIGTSISSTTEEVSVQGQSSPFQTSAARWAQHPFMLGNFPMTLKIGQNNDSWSNTLKMAEKMSNYAAVLKNVQMHDVLCTTNLIHIRGYGN